MFHIFFARSFFCFFHTLRFINRTFYPTIWLFELKLNEIMQHVMQKLLRSSRIHWSRLTKLHKDVLGLHHWNYFGILFLHQTFIIMQMHSRR
ncbi:hypothetical protein VIGAN_04153200 [Vigna angularis var. angularis]|uniref:Uncharacterized protein n=1 Tax=Vigna angularis var. angularis TaxID=157739 RepID=A0A0S3RUQ1_PHAAN|nr:hypothetical protein VIGAN_04153200 [Vigna angularis var. angularis]